MHNLSVLEQSCDIVTCTEAIEHFHAPHVEWALFNKLMASGGVLAIMTKRVLDKARLQIGTIKTTSPTLAFSAKQPFNIWHNEMAMMSLFLPAMSFY